MKSFFVLVCCVLFAGAQLAKAQTCSPPVIVADPRSTNLFTPQQEMVLGDLTVQQLSGEFRQIRDPRLLAYIEGIGARLVRHLPETGLKFKFYIIDYPEANAFNIPGGHVFVTRKLIAFANSEDELAGVIAHELGHAAVRHGALDTSEAMRKILKVSSLGDDKDVAQKFNLLIENARTKRVSTSRGHENGQQMEADKIGFFAMVAAGYDPGAMFTFFDRLTESKGKTGSWFSELFGTTRPEQKRLREIAQATDQLPKECREGRSATATEDFVKWQAEVVMHRDSGRREMLPGLISKKELSPKLRSDVRHLTFNQDGSLLIAQDDFAISVIDRRSLQTVLQIPAEDADKANFTPDGNQIVFTTNNLRFERWDLARKVAVEARELVLRRDCWEYGLSPDGRYLACIDTATTLKIIDTKTGKKVWEKEKFYPLTHFEYFIWLFSPSRSGSEFNTGLFRVGFSPDSRYVMFSRSNKHRYRVRIDMMTVDGSENTALALDLASMKPIDIGGDVKKIASRSYVFLDSQRIVGMTEGKLEAGGIFSFPGGRRLQKLELGGEEIKATAMPNYLVIKPLANAKSGIFDIRRNAVVTGMKKDDLAAWNDIIAFEAASGKIVFRETSYSESEKTLTGKDVGTVELPAALIGGLQVAEVAENFDWLILSSKTRGGLWDLKSGERKMYTRGFRSAVVDINGIGVAQFPKFENEPNNLVLLNSGKNEASVIRELPEFGARQYSRFILTRRSMKEASDEKGLEADLQSQLTAEERAENKLRRNVTFELKDWLQDKVVWTRDFRGDVPRYNFDSYSGRMIFYWRFGSEGGKALLKQDPALKARADALGNNDDDYLIEVVDAYEQKTIGVMPLETGKGSFYVGSGQSEGNWLVVNDSEGRVLVYSLRDGSLHQRFFGRRAAINPTRNQLAVENYPGDVTLYSIDTGEKLRSYAVDGKVVFLRFNLQGNRLFMLSDAQAVYALDLAGTSAAPVAKPVATK